MTSRTRGIHPGGPLNLRLQKSKKWYWITASNLHRNRANFSLGDAPLSSNTSNRISNSKCGEQDPYPYFPYNIGTGEALHQINCYGSNLPEILLNFKEGRGAYSPEISSADSSISFHFGAIIRNEYASNLPDVHISLRESNEVGGISESTQTREDLSYQHPVPGSKCLPDSPRNYSNYESRYSSQERMRLWEQDDFDADRAVLEKRHRR